MAVAGVRPGAGARAGSDRRKQPRNSIKRVGPKRVGPRSVTLSHLTGLHESRRIQKWTVWLTGSIFGKVHTVQKRNGSNNPLVSYTRGNDLSGTMEGAGGIGGLLARSSGYSGGNFPVHNYYFADGNGNITYLLDNSPTMVAKYRYDAFGNTISKSGTLADANVYRFSKRKPRQRSDVYLRRPGF